MKITVNTFYLLLLILLAGCSSDGLSPKAEAAQEWVSDFEQRFTAAVEEATENGSVAQLQDALVTHSCECFNRVELDDYRAEMDRLAEESIKAGAVNLPMMKTIMTESYNMQILQLCSALKEGGNDVLSGEQAAEVKRRIDENCGEAEEVAIDGMLKTYGEFKNRVTEAGLELPQGM